MAARVTSWLSRPGLLRTLLAQVRLAIRLVREPRVPLLTKALPVLAGFYVISPFDFVPDVVPLLGQLDDLGLLLITLELFLKFCPPAAVAFHRAAIEHGQAYVAMPATDDFDNVIDAEWRRQ